MGRFLAGSVASLLLAAAGLFWWQGRAGEERAPPPRPLATGEAGLPAEGDPAARGAPPPMPPEADPRSREQKRFDRYDRNRDGIVTRTEMMASRTNDFRRLDKDGNNLLSFEEWAVRTSERFAGADANRDGKLAPAEFAATAQQRRSAASRGGACSCADDAPDSLK
jgi:hypothetical protein